MIITADTNSIYEQLSNDTYRTTLEGLLVDMVSFNQVDDAFWLARNLEAALTAHRTEVGQQPNLFQPYQRMIATADWVAISHQSEQKVLKMFHENLTVPLLLEEYDLMSALNLLVLSIPILDQRDEFKTRLRRMIETNVETLTDDSLVMGAQSLTPTIGHWILLYNYNVGTQPVATVAFSEFLFSNKNVSHLSPRHRAAIEKLLRLYERLKLSSQTAEGVEGTIAVTDPEHQGAIIGGRFQPYKLDVAEVKSLTALINRALGKSVATPAEPTQRQPVLPPSLPTPIEKAQPVSVDDAITQAENTLLAETEGDVPKLQSALFVALKTTKTNQSIAALLVLARLGGLRNMLMQNKDLASVYENNVVPALTKQLSIDAPKVTKTYTPAHLREFIRFILTQALGSETESARYGAQIEAVMQSTGAQEYANMTYFEPREGTYRWAQAQVDEQGNLQ